MTAFIIAAAVLLIVPLWLVRLFAGPTLHDRALAANGVCMSAALACAAMSAATKQAPWAEAAFALVLAGVVLNVAVLKFFRMRSFQPPLARPQEEA
ncbi:MAG: hypothetical protein KF700_02285 [Hyphomonadaceae bacterium]|nr:hypothetical protein [Hyphomonadaceae bacterium]